MTKWTAGCLAATALLAFLAVGCSVIGVSYGEKHTGPVTVRNISQNDVELIRTNGEFFEMEFLPNGLQPHLAKGDVLGDVVYTDEKNHREFFVKGILNHESPPADLTFYSGVNYGYSCMNNGCIIQGPQSQVYYLWSDGGYRDKPEHKEVKK